MRLCWQKSKRGCRWPASRRAWLPTRSCSRFIGISEILILSRQKKEGWGSKVIDRLSVDLQRELPGQQGFSPRDLKYMRAFAEAWPEALFVQQAAAQTGASAASIVQAPLAQLTWYHHIALLDKADTQPTRLWYAAKAVEHGWSRNVLALQIESDLHKRQGKAVTNFKSTLPPPQSDLAQGILKNPYLFDFLALRDDGITGAAAAVLS